jgi:ABC-2 type transport system permease protein
MNRMLAIVERELRKFFRSPTLLLTSMLLPLVQLLILGNAFGGKVRHVQLGFVNHDHGFESLRVKEDFDAIAANIKTFTVTPYANEKKAVADVRSGKISGVVIIPRQYSRRVLAGDDPNLGLVVDNSDQFVSSAVEAEMQMLVQGLNAPQIPGHIARKVQLKIVELFPYIEYMKFLLAGSTTLAMYVSVMIGGGMLYIDDKARGVHEGYLVTPITKLELVAGLNLAGAIKAVMSGVALIVLGALAAGLGTPFHLNTAFELLLLVVFSSVAFNGMMFLFMVRVEDPLVPRAMFGVLNTLLFFPSGAIYPVDAFPKWLQAIAIVDPFTYAVHGLQSVLLKGAGFAAIDQDLLILFLYGAGTLIVATPLFKRTL